MASATGIAQSAWLADLAERQQRLASTLHSVLDASHLPPDAPDVTALAALVGRWDTDGAQPEDLPDLVAEADVVTATVSKWLLAQPLLAARRVNVALERIQNLKSLPEVLRAAPAELGWAGDFDRVLLSRVEDSSWVPVAWHASHPDRVDNQEMADLLRSSRIVLGGGMVEAETVRRKVTALVRDTTAKPQSFAPFADIANSPAYIVAPVMTGDLVFGLLHADTDESGRPIAECDVATVRAFADGLGLILERLALVDRLRSQKERICSALAAAEHAVDELCSAPVSLTNSVREPVVAHPDAAPTARIEDRFTAREREVFALLVGGATNGQIADRLTVSETTVKSHVKHILRKMRATNRSQAISQYLMTNPTEARR